MDCADWVEPPSQQPRSNLLEEWAFAEAKSETASDDLRQRFVTESPQGSVQTLFGAALLVCLAVAACGIVRGCFSATDAEEVVPQLERPARLVAEYR